MITDAGGQETEVVLVVDDDDAFLETLIEILTSVGIRSVRAGSVSEAVRLQADYLPAVIIVDERLPDGSGTEFAHKTIGHSPDTIVIVITGHAALATATNSVGSFFAYLVKPVAPQVFLQTVEHALARHRTRAVEVVADEAARKISVGIAQSRRLVKLAIGIGLAVVMSLTGLQTYEIVSLNNELNTVTTNQSANKTIFQQTQREAAKTYTLVCGIADTYHVTVCKTVP
jgi:FixJ family two-component response regulator